MAERQPVRNVPDLNLQALLREVERLFDQKLEPIQDRLDRVEGRAQRRRPPLSPPRNRGWQSNLDDEYSESIEHESDQGSNANVQRRGQRNRGQRNRGRFDDDLKSIKLSIPSFQGRSIPKLISSGRKRSSLYLNAITILRPRKLSWLLSNFRTTQWCGGTNLQLAEGEMASVLSKHGPR